MSTSPQVRLWAITSDGVECECAVYPNQDGGGTVIRNYAVLDTVDPRAFIQEDGSDDYRGTYNDVLVAGQRALQMFLSFTSEYLPRNDDGDSDEGVLL